jgi:phenylalanyl-tRNA synthetase alpha chain
MLPSILSPEALARALSVRDLTDEATGPHAMQALVREAVAALCATWRCECIVYRAPPVVSVEDNYDRLHYPPDGAARDARYTRYVTERTLLRTQTSAMIPPLLRELAVDPPRDVLLCCPGLVYRRDSIDRLHAGELHQMDLWRIRSGAPLDGADLAEMITVVCQALLPDRSVRRTPARHPYTTDGLQIDVRTGDDWIEVGECGRALPALLSESGLDERDRSGLAMGLGLDRILMLRKGIDDIRLLRSDDPRVEDQMLDLAPYRPVSQQPEIRRDLSIVVGEDEVEEDLGDRVRGALGPDASSVERVQVLAEAPYAELPEAVARRLGIISGQKNVLVRVILRNLERTLTHGEANGLRDRIYAALHRGPVCEWAARR